MGLVRGGPWEAVNFGDFLNELEAAFGVVHFVVQPLMHILLLISLIVSIMGVTAISTIFRPRLFRQGEWDDPAKLHRLAHSGRASIDRPAHGENSQEPKLGR